MLTPTHFCTCSIRTLLKLAVFWVAVRGDSGCLKQLRLLQHMKRRQQEVEWWSLATVHSRLMVCQLQVLTRCMCMRGRTTRKPVNLTGRLLTNSWLVSYMYMYVHCTCTYPVGLQNRPNALAHVLPCGGHGLRMRITYTYTRCMVFPFIARAQL